MSPRLGTISPWSSKATDIARNCGFATVRRVERVVVFDVDLHRSLLGTASLDESELAALVGGLHDRMTESVLASQEACAALFQHYAPKPLGQVSLADGRAALERANGELGLALSDDEVD